MDWIIFFIAFFFLIEGEGIVGLLLIIIGYLSRIANK